MTFISRFARHVAERYGRTLAVQVGVSSIPGTLHQVNEDAVLFSSSPAGVGRTPGAVVVVADGMGGHAGGALASRIATETVQRTLSLSDGVASDALRTAFEAANASIRKLAQAEAGLGGMGTTCVALALRQGRAYVASVGDSRAYRIRRGRIRQLTTDHSFVADLVRRKLISPAEARRHPDRHLLLRALGTSDGPDADVRKAGRVKLDDCFVLSTDGLHGSLEDAEILDASFRDRPGIVCERLVALARQNGADDDVTVAFVRVVQSARVSAGARPTLDQEIVA